MFIACFVHERKHKMLKRYLNDIRNTIVFEKSVLSEVTCHHIFSLQNKSFDFSPGLLKPHAASAKTRAFFLDMFEFPADMPVMQSSTSRHRALATTSVGDVVMYNDPSGGINAGQVWTHVAIDGLPVSMFQKLELESLNKSSMTAIFKITNEHVTLPTEDILDAVIWEEFRPGFIRVLIPPELSPSLA